MSRPVFWFDCDGVLLDWTRPFLEFSGLNVKYEDLTDIDLSKLYENPDDFLELMHLYHKSDIFSNLSPIVPPEALYWLKGTTRSEMNVITQIENEFIPRHSRTTNLRNKFGNVFNQINFTIRGECKLERILSERPNEQHMIVEDHPRTLKRIADQIKEDMIHKGKTNLAAVGIVHPYNKAALEDIEFITKVDSTETAILFISEWANGW